MFHNLYLTENQDDILPALPKISVLTTLSRTLCLIPGDLLKISTFARLAML